MAVGSETENLNVGGISVSDPSRGSVVAAADAVVGVAPSVVFSCGHVIPPRALAVPRIERNDHTSRLAIPNS